MSRSFVFKPEWEPELVLGDVESRAARLRALVGSVEGGVEGEARAVVGTLYGALVSLVRAHAAVLMNPGLSLERVLELVGLLVGLDGR